MGKSSQIDWTHVDAAMLQYRKEYFAVEVTPARHPLEEGQACLSVTNNGSQWETISLLKGEIPKVIKALQEYDRTN